MKEIELTQGKIALVDDEDFERVSQYKWYANYCGGNWYAVRHTRKLNGGQTTQRMHRLIMNCPEELQVDHKNHNGLDNRRRNLRMCILAQNNMNRKPNKRKTTSKYKGVYWNKSHKKWYARIKLGRKQIHLGCFLNEIDAAKSYDKKAIKLFGEFAYLNFQ